MKGRSTIKCRVPVIPNTHAVQLCISRKPPEDICRRTFSKRTMAVVRDNATVDHDAAAFHYSATTK
jgi:hypothetical protein